MFFILEKKNIVGNDADDIQFIGIKLLCKWCKKSLRKKVYRLHWAVAVAVYDLNSKWNKNIKYRWGSFGVFFFSRYFHFFFFLVTLTMHMYKMGVEAFTFYSRHNKVERNSLRLGNGYMCWKYDVYYHHYFDVCNLLLLFFCFVAVLSVRKKIINEHYVVYNVTMLW